MKKLTLGLLLIVSSSLFTTIGDQSDPKFSPTQTNDRWNLNPMTKLGGVILVGMPFFVVYGACLYIKEFAKKPLNVAADILCDTCGQGSDKD